MTRFGNRAVWPLVPLRRGSRPTKCDELEQAKRERCARYGNCLDHAAGKNWGGWSCARCPVREEMTKGDVYVELEPLADLLAEIVGPRAIRITKPYFWRRA